jgi:hypothetical protein
MGYLDENLLSHIEAVSTIVILVLVPEKLRVK